MAVRPHAVSQTVTTGSTAATRSYEYDAAGGRVIRQESGKTTLTVAGTELTVDNATGTATASRYYAHAGQAVAVRTGNTNAELFSLINDHQGTAHNQIRNSDSQLQSIWQDPYGNKRGTAPAAWAGGRGFVGGLNDVSTGLVRLGARDFDPVLQRFTTVDPVQVLDVPLQWNPYLYGDNSPVTKADPSGLCWICGIGNAIASAARAVVGVVKATVTKVASAVKRVATAVVKKVASVAAKVVHEAVKVAKKIARAVTTAVRTVKAAVKHAVKKAVSKAKHVASSAGKAVDHAKKAVSEGVKRAGDTLNEYGDAIQLGLDVVGLVPVVGEIADGANAIIYAAKGDYANAALSAAAMIPIGGQAATAAKLGIKAGNALVGAASTGGRMAGSAMRALPRGGVKLTQGGLEHIVYRHWATSGFDKVGKFAPGSTARSVRQMVEDTARNGAMRSNTAGRPGTIFEHDLGRTIGTNGAGDPTSRLRVVASPDATVITAFPY